MTQKLKVSFDNPEHGWVGLFINYGDNAMSIIASYTPSDSFLDLTNALHGLMYCPIEATVIWHEEPAGRVGDWRAGLGRSLYSLLPRPFGCEVSQHLDHAHVSSPRHVERSVWISLTTLTCLLHAKVYETYLAGATFGCG